MNKNSLENLTLIIEIINLVSPNDNLPDPAAIYFAAMRRFGRDAENIKETFDRSSEICRMRLQMFPDLLNYLENIDEYWTTYSESFYVRYEDFWEWREEITKIARKTNVYARRKARQKPLAFTFLTKISISLCVNDDGKFTAASFLAKNLEGIEAERLRRCQICRRVFWAYRLDKWTCSVKCGQVRRTRKKRIKAQKLIRIPSEKGDQNDGTL